MKTEWKASNINRALNLGNYEFQDIKGEYHDFEILDLPDRILFGGVCNTGFLESGYILKEEYEHEGETLQELCNDLETYYNEGAMYTSRISHNGRM